MWVPTVQQIKEQAILRILFCMSVSILPVTFPVNEYLLKKVKKKIKILYEFIDMLVKCYIVTYFKIYKS